MGLALGHHAVHRDLLSRANPKEVALLHIGDRDLFFAALRNPNGGFRGHADQLLDRREVFAVDRRRQGEGVTFPAGATGAPDAVHVILGMHRHVEIENVAEALDVDAPRGNVAAHHQACFALLELVQRLGARRLGHVAMQTDSIEAVLGERLEQDLDIALAVAEDQRVGDVLAAQQLAQCLALHLGLDDGEALDHGAGCGCRRCDADLLRVHQERVGQLADLRRHGGGEEQGLAQLRQQADDALDVRDEAHVEHAIGFVDHQDLDVVHQDLAALEQVDQAAGRGDQHVDAAIQLLLLIGEAFTADQQRIAQIGILAVFLETVCHLRRQFPSRLQDEGARHAGLGPAPAQDLDHGKGEAGGLSGAGLGASQNVSAHENHRNCLGLDGGGLLIAEIGNRLQDSGAEPQFFERHYLMMRAFTGIAEGRRRAGGARSRCREIARTIGIGQTLSIQPRSSP